MAATERLRSAPLDPSYAAAGFALSAEAGWNQTGLDWRLMLETGEAIGQLTPEGSLVASALILPYGEPPGVAWIGMVLTTARWRRHGLATANLRWAIERCRARGLLAGLDATPDGRLVYQPLGFRDLLGLCRWRAAAPALEPVAPRGIAVRPMSKSDLPTVVRLDAEAFGAGRRALIAHLHAAQSGHAFVAETRTGLAGMVLSRAGRLTWHLGPLCAERPEVAMALLGRAVAGVAGPVSLDVPDAQTGFLDWLREGGFEQVRPFTRMLQSEQPRLGRPEMMFAIAGPELG